MSVAGVGTGDREGAQRWWRTVYLPLSVPSSPVSTRYVGMALSDGLVRLGKITPGIIYYTMV